MLAKPHVLNCRGEAWGDRSDGVAWHGTQVWGRPGTAVRELVSWKPEAPWSVAASSPVFSTALPVPSSCLETVLGLRWR